MTISINNRRYLGNKYKLLPFISEIVENECPNVNTIFDVFAGTGAVASAFLDKTVILNDLLYSNYISHIAWFSPEKYDKYKVEEIIDTYNAIENLEGSNYMSENFGNTFFSEQVCKIIGYIREDIEEKYKTEEINLKEKAILITSLLYAMDKIANTCGHYDAYRKNAEFNNNFKLEMPEISSNLSKNNKCYNMDSNKLAPTVKCDLAYLDPPYNSRQYCDNYHLLENVAKWEKPEVAGIARKMDRKHIKSDYCKSTAANAFEDLISKLDCKYILLSYNNTADTANGRSNAKISDEDIIRILSKKGDVKIFTTKYKAFTTGISENNKNEERVFLCTVNKKKQFIQSPLNYTGGKFKLLKQITPLFPTYIDNFVDLFCGGCNVGINVTAENHYYNDLNKDLIGLLNTFKKLSSKTIFEQINLIINEYNLSDSTKYGYEYYNCNSSDGLGSYNKSNFNKLKSDFNKLPKTHPNYYIIFYVLIIFSFNNQIRFNSKGEFNLPVGKRDFNNKLKLKLENFLVQLKNQNAYISNKDFNDINLEHLTKNSLVYADPPYLITTASYNENNGWNETKERQLLAFLDNLNEKNIKFALSNVLTHKGKSNHILESWLKENKSVYTVHHLNHNYSNSNYQTKDKDSKSDEVLITNY